MIAYWKFDDGDPLADASGNGYTLTNATGMTTDKCAAVFNGTQDDIKITAAALDVSEFMTKRSTPQGTIIRVQ